MALMESVDGQLGTSLPTFELADPDGERYSSHDLSGAKGLLIAVTCNHCPYAIALWPRLIELAGVARGLGIETVALNPNMNPAYPDDSPEAMRAKIQEWGLDFPYLVDEQQQVARALRAQCTPEFFLYDADRVLVYHGRLDDNWKEPERVTSEELREAIEALASGGEVSARQNPALGCSIKWLKEP